MSEIGTQLRTYFDETVERVTEEDVRIRATTERGIPIPSPRFRPRPLAAGAIGFGLAMTLLGVVLVVDRVFGAGVVSDVGGNGGNGVVPRTEQGSLWLFIPVIFGLGLLATGIISARRRNGDMRERGEETMQSIETVETVEAPLDKQILTLKKRDRRLAWLAGILAIAVVAMGAWMMFGGDSGQSLTAEQEQMIKTIEASEVAWNAGDGAGVAALMLPSGYHDNGAARYLANDGTLAAYVEQIHGMGFSVESFNHTVVGDFVISEAHIPANSSEVAVAIARMTPDGTLIMWHYAP